MFDAKLYYKVTLTTNYSHKPEIKLHFYLARSLRIHNQPEKSNRNIILHFKTSRAKDKSRLQASKKKKKEKRKKMEKARFRADSRPTQRKSPLACEIRVHFFRSWWAKSNLQNNSRKTTHEIACRKFLVYSPPRTLFHSPIHARAFTTQMICKAAAFSRTRDKFKFAPLRARDYLRASWRLSGGWAIWIR